MSTTHLARLRTLRALSVAPQQIIGYVNGKPVRAIAGGSGESGSGGGDGGSGGDGGNGSGDGGNGGGSGQGGGSGSGTGSGGGSDKGFPENTPLEQMTAEQREAYWKHHARKWESQAKSGPSQQELDELKRKAGEYDKVRQAEMSDLEKANERLAQQEEELQKYRLKEMREQAAKAAELPLEDAEWITATELEAAKVQAQRLKERLGAAAQGAGGGNGGQGGTGGHYQQGYQGRGEGKAAGVAAGRDLYAERHKKKN